MNLSEYIFFCMSTIIKVLTANLVIAYHEWERRELHMQAVKKMYDRFGFYAFLFCRECSYYIGSKKDGYHCRKARELGVVDCEMNKWRGSWPACRLILTANDKQVQESSNFQECKQMSFWDLDGVVPDGIDNPFGE